MACAPSVSLHDNSHPLSLLPSAIIIDDIARLPFSRESLEHPTIHKILNVAIIAPLIHRRPTEPASYAGLIAPDPPETPAGCGGRRRWRTRPRAGVFRHPVFPRTRVLEPVLVFVQHVPKVWSVTSVYHEPMFELNIRGDETMLSVYGATEPVLDRASPERPEGWADR